MSTGSRTGSTRGRASETDVTGQSTDGSEQAASGFPRLSIRGRAARGQTTLDFTAGMSVFLLVLVAVLLFIPGTLQPFTQGDQDNIVAANRVADELSEGLLGNPASPHVLNTSCTIEFFDGDGSSGNCRFSGSDIRSRVGLARSQFVNVSLRGNVTDTQTGKELLCWSDGGQLVERSQTANCETLLAAGQDPPERSGSAVTARRVVTINRSAGSAETVDVALVVEVW